MKKLLFAIIIWSIAHSIIFAQSVYNPNYWDKPKEQSVLQLSDGSNTYKNTIGLGVTTTAAIDINYICQTDNLLPFFDKYGFGMDIGLKSSGSGEDYTSKDFTNGFNDQQYLDSGDIVNGFGMYGIIGKQWGFFSLSGKLGFGTITQGANYYDPDRIFGDNGYYYKTIVNETKLLAGGVLGFDYTERINLNMGFDTYNQITFGVGIKF